MYDIEILEVALQCEIDIIGEIHLLKIIEEELQNNKKSGIKWEYREVRIPGAPGMEMKVKKYWVH